MNSKKILSFWLVALSLFAVNSARAEIEVTEAQTSHFAGVVGNLQTQLAERATNLNTPQGVGEYRDLQNVLRLLADVLGFNKPDWNGQSLFASYLYRTNWWVTRNLRLANTHNNDSENLFPAMFEIFDTYTDEEIAKSGELRAPLVRAAKAIEQTSFLEGVVEAEPEPPRARLSDKELDLAVLLAAMGVTFMPNKIYEWFDQNFSEQSSALKFYNDFLHQPVATKRLRALSTKSAIAAVGMGIVESPKFTEHVDAIAVFGGTSGNARTPSTTAPTRQLLDAVIEVIRTTKSDYQSGTATSTAPSRPAIPQPAPRLATQPVPGVTVPLPRTSVTLPSPPFIREPQSVRVRPASTAFNPQSTVDLATLSSKLMYQMAMQAQYFANDLDEDQEIAQLREFRALRTIAENLDFITDGWTKGEEKGKPFVRLLYQVNPWVMRNLMALRRDGGAGQGTQLQRLHKALKGYNVTAIRAAAVAVHDRQLEESVAAQPQEVSVDESDLLGVTTIALAYLRIAPEILIHDQHWRGGNSRPNIPEIAENIRKCLVVVAQYKPLIQDMVKRFQDRPSISNLNWNVWYDSAFPIATLAEKGEALSHAVELVRLQVLGERNWAPQLIRICLGTGVRRGSEDTCSHWDLLDAHFGIRPEFKL